MIGIYKITNLKNNKIYIGQSKDIQRRWNEHKYDERHNSPIHNAIKKYGIDNFQFEVIEECSLQELNEREKYWIEYYDSYNNGYNLTLGGDGIVLYNYEDIYKDFLITKNMAHTALNQNCSVGTVRLALRTYDINLSECSASKPIE